MNSYKRKIGINIVLVFACAFIAVACNDGGQNQDPDDPIVDFGGADAWDNGIREIGNIVRVGNTEYFYYSGFNGDYKRGFHTVYCGVAINNGKGWQKQGKVGDFLCEDPYTVYQDGTFYLYFEDKEVYPDFATSLATSEDGINFEFKEKHVLHPTEQGWQSQDTGSSIVVPGSPNIMIYEGRGEGQYRPIQGFIGIATNNSLTGIWEKNSLPIIMGSYPTLRDLQQWDAYVATDDIAMINDIYYMTMHALSHENGGMWTSGLWQSKDLLQWSKVVDAPIWNSDTVMIHHKSSCLAFFGVNGNGVDYYDSGVLQDHGVPVCD